MKRIAPSWLNVEGKAFWKKHAKDLPENANSETFALLCDVQSRWKAIDPSVDSKAMIAYIALCKQYTALAKLFGLFPDKTKKKVEPTKDEHDEFNDL
jgi:phage terminase small subunit